MLLCHSYRLHFTNAVRNLFAFVYYFNSGLMFLLRWALACIAIAYTVPVFAGEQQNGCTDSLMIQVNDAETRLPVPGVVISMPSLQTQTDLDGKVIFHNLCKGDRLRLHIHATGYQVMEEDLKYTGTDSTLLLLQPLRNTLDAIEVNSHKQSVAFTNTVATLDQDALDKMKGKNLAGVLSSIAGVNVLQTGATIGKPVINGLHSNRIIILNNGIRQEGQQWGAEHAPEIDPSIAQNISVIKGAEAIRYGPEAIGGVIIVEPPPLSADSGIHAELSLTAASNGRSGKGSAMLSGNINRIPGLSWRVQGSGLQSGNFKTPDYYLDNTGTKEFSYSAALGYTGKHMAFDLFYSRFNTELGIFKGSHIGSKEDLMAAIEHGSPFSKGSFYYDIDAPRQHVDHDLLKATGHIHLHDKLHLNIQYGFQKNRRQEYDIRRAGRSSIPSMDIALLTQTLDAHIEYFNGKDWKGFVGVNGTLQNNSSAAELYTTPLIPDYNSSAAGMYAIARLLKDVYELEAGIRYDYKYLTALGYRGSEMYGGKHSFSNISGSLGATYRLSNQSAIKSGISTAWRPPTVNELYSTGLHHGAAAVEYGDSNLRSEKSVQWMNSLQYTNRSGWLSIDANAYLRYFDGYIYLMPTGKFSESLRGTFPIFATQSTNALFTGMDLTARVSFLRYLEYSVKGAVIRAKDVTHDRYLPGIPSDRVEQSLTFHYKQFFFLKENYLQLTHAFVARQNRYEENSDFAPPPDAYHLLNINLGTKLHIGKHHLSVNFGIDNLTNTIYKDYMNRYRYYAHDIGRNYVLRLTYRI